MMRIGPVSEARKALCRPRAAASDQSSQPRMAICRSTPNNDISLEGPYISSAGFPGAGQFSPDLTDRHLAPGMVPPRHSMIALCPSPDWPASRICPRPRPFRRVSGRPGHQLRANFAPCAAPSQRCSSASYRRLERGCQEGVIGLSPRRAIPTDCTGAEWRDRPVRGGSASAE